MRNATKPFIRLPRMLAYTTIGCGIAGALACSSQGIARPDASTDALAAHDSSRDASSADASTTDASTTDAEIADAPTEAPVAYDSAAACGDTGIPSFCGAAGACDAQCPCTGAWYCTDTCPSGCVPFA